jgi:hypothetical protein
VQGRHPVPPPAQAYHVAVPLGRLRLRAHPELTRSSCGVKKKKKRKKEKKKEEKKKRKERSDESEEGTNEAMEYIKKQVEDVHKAMEAEVARVAELQAKLETERSRFEEYKIKIASVHFPATIKLDVGGRRFKTTTATLCREESMLSAMFSGKGFKVEQDEDGCFFIDRPGAPFEHILHYLQTGVFIPPTDPALLKAVKLEADFYQVRFVSCFGSAFWPPGWASHAWAHSSLWQNRSKAWSTSWRGTTVHSPISTTIRASCTGSAPIGGQPRTGTRSTLAW